MPITVVCGCGKRIKVRDELVGRMAKCPGCGQPVKLEMPEAPVVVVLDDEVPADATAGWPKGPSWRNVRLGFRGDVLARMALYLIVFSCVLRTLASPFGAAKAGSERDVAAVFRARGQEDLAAEIEDRYARRERERSEGDRTCALCFVIAVAGLACSRSSKD